MADLNVVAYRPERASTRGPSGRRTRDEGQPGDVLEVWTEDCFAGLVETVDDLPSGEDHRVQPADRTVLRRGRRTRDTLALTSSRSSRPATGRCRRRSRCSARSVRAAHGDAAGPAPRDRVAVRRRCRSQPVRFAARNGEYDDELRSIRCTGPSASRPRAEARPRSSPTRTAAAWTRPRCGRAPTTWASTSRGAVLARRRPLPPGRGRDLRRGRGGGDGHRPGVELIKAAPWPRPRNDDLHHVDGLRAAARDAFRIAHGDLVMWLVEEFGLDSSTRTSSSPRCRARPTCATRTTRSSPRRRSGFLPARRLRATRAAMLEIAAPTGPSAASAETRPRSPRVRRVARGRTVQD